MNSPSWRGRLLLLFVAGCAVIGVQVALGSLLVALVPPVPWLGIAFLTGVPLGFWITRLLPPLMFPAIGLLALIGVVPALVVDVPLWGGVASFQDTHDVPVDTGVAGYLVSGWHIDVERASDERLTTGRGKSYGSRRLAPLVSSDWTPARPVEVWVSGETRDSGRILPSHPQFWNEPGGEFIRVVGNDVAMARLAAGRAARKFGLYTAQQPLIVMRVASVRQALTDQYWALARAIGVAAAIWALFMGVAAVVLTWREGRAVPQN